MAAFRPGQSPPPVRTPTVFAIRLTSGLAGRLFPQTSRELHGGETMPKAGVEPARGQAPVDFEASASPSPATAAEAITRNGIGTVAGRSSRRHNGAPQRAARSGVSPR